MFLPLTLLCCPVAAFCPVYYDQGYFDIWGPMYCGWSTILDSVVEWLAPYFLDEAKLSTLDGKDFPPQWIRNLQDHALRRILMVAPSRIDRPGAGEGLFLKPNVLRTFIFPAVIKFFYTGWLRIRENGVLSDAERASGKMLLMRNIHYPEGGNYSVFVEGDGITSKFNGGDAGSCVAEFVRGQHINYVSLDGTKLQRFGESDEKLLYYGPEFTRALAATASICTKRARAALKSSAMSSEGVDDDSASVESLMSLGSPRAKQQVSRYFHVSSRNLLCSSVVLALLIIPFYLFYFSSLLATCDQSPRSGGGDGGRGGGRRGRGGGGGGGG